MSKEFTALKIDGTDRILPVILVGPNGAGKNIKFLSSLSTEKTNAMEYETLNIDLTTAVASDVANPFNSHSVTANALSKIEEKARSARNLVVVTFDSADKYDQVVLSDLLDKLGSLTARIVIPVFSCETIPAIIKNSPQRLEKLQVVEWQTQANIPIFTNSVRHDSSPLHGYRNMINDLALSPTAPDVSQIQEKLETLRNFAQALDGIDGGMFGQKAMDRGMDITVANAMHSFANKFKGSNETQLADVANQFSDLISIENVQGKLIDRTITALGLEPDEPSLG